MKSLLAGFFWLCFLCSFSQTSDFEIAVVQNGKSVDIINNEATIDKAPFQLIYKFKKNSNWGLIAGNNEGMKATFERGQDAMKALLLNADFGGATGYFNESESILAWNGIIETKIRYEDDLHHSFDSLYKKDHWIFGVRTVTYLSTKEDLLLVEEWPDSILILATGKTSFQHNEKVVENTAILKLKLKEIPSFSALDVKGKVFHEDGVAEFQPGCEGCGNLGFYEFKKNGKDVVYLWSGSDIISFGPYVQKDNRIEIEGGETILQVNPDGNQLTDLKTGTVFKLSLPQDQ